MSNGRIDAYIHKTVQFQFSGISLKIALSQSLFSSFEIDRGSRLLLKCVAGNVPLENLKSVLDMGCGVGVLGLSLKRRCPRLELTLSDRDALALAFAGFNAEMNGLEAHISARLGFRDLSGPFDLIVSNLPAKAGQPVLEHFIAEGYRHLSNRGIFAFVLVRPLRSLAEQVLEKLALDTLHSEHTGNHSVFLIQEGSGPADPEAGSSETTCTLAPYIRGKHDFQHLGLGWQLDTVFNLPDFDTLSYETRVTLDLFEKIEPVEEQRILFWNPGQGHLPLYLLQKARFQCSLAGRDLLQLAVSGHNVTQAGFQLVEAVHTALLADVAGNYQGLVVCPDLDPGVPWPETILEQCAALVTEKGSLIIVSKSSRIQRLKRNRSFHLVRDKKIKGYRGLLFVKVQ